jgi:ZIP family zinc transporter
VTTLEPFTAVVLLSAAAALTAILGALPQAVGGPPSDAVVGWANALAGGLMIGVAYALLTEGLGGGLAGGGIGALIGIAFVRGTHSLTGTGELDLEEPGEANERFGNKAILTDALHAAHEGVAIGAAMAVSLPLGVVMAATLAAHNVPEAMVLNGVLTRRGLGLPLSATISTAVNVNQVVFGVLSFALLGFQPALLPWITGFAVGALIYLTLVELLPESYRQAGHTSIALVTLVAMGVVVLLSGTAR